MGGKLRQVKKTSLYLEPELDRALATRAEREGITKAQLVRQLLAAAVENGKRPRPTIGVFQGPGDLAQNVDRYLDETGFGEW